KVRDSAGGGPQAFREADQAGVEVRAYLMKMSAVRDFRVSGKFPAAGKRKDRQRIGSADPSMLPPVPGTERPLEIWLGRSNRFRAGLAGSWTTRAQARRVPADPTADRKPKACQ